MEKLKQNKSFFDEIADGTLKYYKTELKNVKITVDGNTATLSCTAYLTAKVYGMSGTFPMNVNAHFTKIKNKRFYSN